MPDVPVANSISLSEIIELVVESVVVVPLTVKFPDTVKLFPIVTLLGNPTVIVPEDSPTSTSFVVPENVIVPPNAVAVDVEPSVTVIDELLNFELPILPASFEAAIEPANIVFVTEPVSPVVTIVPETLGTVIVLSAVGSVTDIVVSKLSAVEPSKIIPPDVIVGVVIEGVVITGLVSVLFVSVFDVPENKVSNCASVTRPSVPPSDNKSKSVVANVALVKSVAPSILTIASTLPNSNALAPELTFNT